MNRPTIVCLCGSMRFVEQMREVYQSESLKGRIVLAPACMWGCDGHEPEEKTMLDKLHMQKIDLSDEVLVIDIGGYVGESTASEIAHAHAVSKRVRYLSKERT